MAVKKKPLNDIADRTLIGYPIRSRGWVLIHLAFLTVAALPTPREPEIASDKRDSRKTYAGDRSRCRDALGTACTPTKAGRRSPIFWLRGKSWRPGENQQREACDYSKP